MAAAPIGLADERELRASLNVETTPTRVLPLPVVFIGGTFAIGGAALILLAIFLDARPLAAIAGPDPVALRLHLELTGLLGLAGGIGLLWGERFGIVIGSAALLDTIVRTGNVVRVFGMLPEDAVDEPQARTLALRYGVRATLALLYLLYLWSERPLAWCRVPIERRGRFFLGTLGVLLVVEAARLAASALAGR